MAKLTVDDALSFYRAHYVPSNAVLLVVGDVTPSDVKRLAEKYYGPLLNRDMQPLAPRPPEPARTKPERLTLEDARVTDQTLMRIYNIGANTETTPRQAAAYAVLASIVGSNSQSRLIKQLVSREQLAASLFTSFRNSTDDYGLFYVFGIARSNVNISTLEQRIDAVLQEVKDRGVTQDELQEAINTSVAKDIYARDSVVSIGTQAAEVRASGRTSSTSTT